MTGHYFAPRVNNYSLARNKFQNRRIKHYKSRFHNYTLFTSISVLIIKMLLILQKTLRKYISEVRLEPSRTPSIKLFAKIVNGFQLMSGWVLNASLDFFLNSDSLMKTQRCIKDHAKHLSWSLQLTSIVNSYKSLTISQKIPSQIFQSVLSTPLRVP